MSEKCFKVNLTPFFFIEFWNDNYLVSLFYGKEYVRLFVHNLINNLKRSPFDDVTICRSVFLCMYIIRGIMRFSSPC